MKYASIGYLWVVVLLTMPAAAGADPHAASQIARYRVTEIDVGPLDFISDMNERGHMVGLGYSEDVPKVFVWDRRRGLEFIDGLVAEEGFIGNAYGINDRDQIVGTRGVGPGGSILRAFVWDRAKGLRLLQPLPGDDHSGGIDINNWGQVIGTSGPYPDEGATGIRGVIWDRRYGVQVLDGQPVDINDAGEVAGIVYTQGEVQSYIWDRTNGTRMLGSPEGGGGSSASAINDRGEIVGTISAGNGQHAFLWREDSGIVDLGDLAGGPDLSSANDINNSGQIVGYGAEQGGSQAVIWDSQGVLHNLNDLIVREEPNDQFWYMFNARQINDAGWIVVNALDTRDPTRQWHQLLLTPVRHPAR